MYLALGTQLDIAYAINRLAQFTQEPKLKHWTAIKQVFHYLKGTGNNTLTYGGAEELLNENLSIYLSIYLYIKERVVYGYLVNLRKKLR